MFFFFPMRFVLFLDSVLRRRGQEGRKEGRKGGRKGEQEGRKEGRKQRKEGSKEGMREGRWLSVPKC